MANAATETITCRITPNARKSEILGWGSDEKGRPVLMVKIQAPPVEGKANEELIRFMAEVVGCGRGQMQLIRGASSRVKVLEGPVGMAEALNKVS